MVKSMAVLGALMLLAPVAGATAPAAGTAVDDWATRFALVPPAASTQGVCPASAAGLPTFAVVPAAAGAQVVRVSLPFAPGSFPAEAGLAVRCGDRKAQPDVRPLTYYPGKRRFVRRAIITFRHDFPDLAERQFQVSLDPRERPTPAPAPATGRFEGRVGETEVVVDAASVRVRRGTGPAWRAEAIAPARAAEAAPVVEVIERGEHFLWVRVLAPEPVWPRIVEVRADSLGTVGVRLHVQRLQPGDGTAPDLGWRIEGPAAGPVRTAKGVPEGGVHAFGSGEDAWCEGEAGWARFPDAPLFRRGGLAARARGEGSEVTYLRCRAEERVPHQEAAWRTAAAVLGPAGAAPWTPLLEPAHRVRIPARCFDPLYGTGESPDLSAWPALAELSAFHRGAVAQSALAGDDSGSVTGYKAGVFGMNRLNHCPAIFEEHARSGDARLRETAVRWCENFHDLSVWWGTGRPGELGGTRYNNVTAQGSKEHAGDKSFMWRSNSAVTFCTKGFDAFFVAYEETGDPRMATALRWQVDYSRRMVNAGANYCRNIGMAEDFLRLYRFTGDDAHLREALRLFVDLRPLLSEGHLFTESGKPIHPNPPFIENDKDGYAHPFAKPYIIGYALVGLPELLRHRPDEPKLPEVVRAVADFLAATVDPAGGWRYPHPRSRTMLVQQGIEHAAQIARAAAVLEERGEPIGPLLDAIECVLQARVIPWRKIGTFFSSLGGWEEPAGVLKGKGIGDLYAKPADRDPTRDYTEGRIGIGSASPEGIVHFWEVLSFYLAHRPAERLFQPNAKLKLLLDRM